MITLTEKAQSHIHNILKTKEKTKGIRLGVKKAGCNGLSYLIDLAEDIGSDDTLFEQKGITMIVNSESLPFIDGMELDYVENGLNGHLKFNNPNAKGACGCGESFNVKE